MIKSLTKGAKGSAIETIVGAVAFYGHKMAADKINAVQTKWWLGPAGLVAIGHFAKRSRKLNVLGAALCGAGGYAAAQNYLLNKAVQNTNKPAGTSGMDDDTGALTSPGDIGALTSPSDIGDMESYDISSAMAL